MVKEKNKFTSVLLLLLSAGFLFLLTTTALCITEQKTITIGTTTSVHATGLLDRFVEEFNNEHGNIRVKTFAVGSGAALKLAEKGEADVIIVHSPADEREYIGKGVLQNHEIIAYNNFIIAGPGEDPANIKNAENEIEAFRAIYEAGEQGKAIFISRGDNSGTHKRELMLWKKALVKPFNKSWYIEAGAGMDIVLKIADEKRAYTLSDIGTYLFLKKNQRIKNIQALINEGELLKNIYSIYLVKGHRKDAELFYNFVLSEKGKSIIKSYSPLFYLPYDGIEEDWEKLAAYAEHA